MSTVLSPKQATRMETNRMNRPAVRRPTEQTRQRLKPPGNLRGWFSLGLFGVTKDDRSGRKPSDPSC
ncbi:MAG: hypothetical protein AAF547_04140 [Actinomycetota bacterium]